MHWSRKLAPFGLALVLPLAACGSDGESAGASDPDGPIRIAVIASLESATWSLPQVEDAVEGALHVINKDGGVDGRHIEATFCNEKFDANEAAACAQRAVSEKAVAMVGVCSIHSKVIADVALAAGIPVVGPCGGDGPAEATHEAMYPINSGAASQVMAAGAVAVEEGGPRIVGITEDNPSAVASLQKVVPQGVEAAGGEIIKEVITPAGLTDFLAPATAALDAAPDGIVMTQGADWGARMVGALRDAGFDGPISGSASMLSSSLLPSLGDKSNNVFAGSRGLPATDTSNEAIVRYQKELRAANPDAAIDDIGLSAWMAVQFFKSVIEGHDITDGQSVIDALNDVTADDPIDQFGVYRDWPGLADPPHQEYPRVADFHAGVIKVEDGKLVPAGWVDPLD
jgi:ABC-type branched-subunit amino acid transport system substrate-binding protein